MKTFSIDIIAIPLLYIPIVLLIMTTLTTQLYLKTKRMNDAYLGIVLLISSIVAFLPYQWANGELLLFWSPPFHLATTAVILAVGASLFCSGRLARRQEWLYGLMLLVVMTTPYLSPTVAGTCVGLAVTGYGVFLLIEIRYENSNEQILALALTCIGLFSFIGHWFPLNGGRFLYGVFLILLLCYEMIRFFERVVLLLQTASVNSMTDALTGLYNKGYFLQKAEILIRKQEISIIFADIDNFKNLNDTKGHEHGDLVLQQVASLFQEVIGKSGYVCRYGGEEMVAIIEKGEDAEEIANRLCRQIAKKTEVTLSIGVASGTGNSQSLIKLADERMYTAKGKGKNQVIIN